MECCKRDIIEEEGMGISSTNSSLKTCLPTIESLGGFLVVYNRFIRNYLKLRMPAAGRIHVYRETGKKINVQDH